MTTYIKVITSSDPKYIPTNIILKAVSEKYNNNDYWFFYDNKNKFVARTYETNRGLRLDGSKFEVVDADIIGLNPNKSCDITIEKSFAGFDGGSSKTRTNKHIIYNGRKCIIYKGSRNGKYIKQNGKFVSVKSL